jgi:hypothetical protein
MSRSVPNQLGNPDRQARGSAVFERLGDGSKADVDDGDADGGGGVGSLPETLKT